MPPQNDNVFVNPEIRHAYSPRRASVWTTSEPSMTKQSFRDEVNINVIMKKFFKTGTIQHLNDQEPNYGFAPSEDFRSALAIIQTAEEGFAALPSELRREFGEDPNRFLQFVEDPNNHDALADMGLLSEEATQAVLSARDDENDKNVGSPPPTPEEPPAGE